MSKLEKTLKGKKQFFRVLRNYDCVLDFFRENINPAYVDNSYIFLPPQNLSFLRVRLDNEVTYVFTSKSSIDIYDWLYLHKNSIKSLILRYYETLY